MSALEKIKNDLAEVMKTIQHEFGADGAIYAIKNPGLVQFLMDKIQQEEDRAIHRQINGL